VHPTLTGPVGEVTAQRGGLHLLRGPLAVVPRHGTVDHTTTGELRRPDRALPGPAGALLTVRLAAATAHLTAGLGLVRPLAGGGHLRHHDLVHQRDVGLHIEDRGWQLHRAGLLPVQTDDVHGAHFAAAPFRFAAVRISTSPPL